VNVYVFADGECTGDMRIWRHRERGNFDANEIEALRLVEPAFAGALARFKWEAAPASSARAHEGVSELLQRKSALSQREAQAAALVVSGCPDKLIAKRMAVGLPTVRFHLGNAFRKLRVDNRTQLAARVQSMINGDALADG
jgi:DNA-binding CsgD family transcriptional regulator